MATDAGAPSMVSVLEELDRYKSELSRETSRRRAVEDALAKTKATAAATQIMVEQEEEFIANKLMKRLNELKSEKEQLAMQIEQEEEYLTNNLQMKLDQLKREKIEMENQLEQEQEYIVNKLQRQLDEMRIEKRGLEKKVEELSRAGTPATLTPSTSRAESPASSLRSGALDSVGLAGQLARRSFSRDSAS